MNIASIKLCDCANGPGIRTSVFVSGCRRHCKGCFNEVAWDFKYGQRFTPKMLNYIRETLDSPNVDGLTLLGGEPFEPENMPFCHAIASSAKFKGKNVWVYTGFTFEELLSRPVTADDVTGELLETIDVLVDGPFLEEQKDITLKFRGSRNQRIIDVQKSLETVSVVLMEEWMK